jgi:aspartate/methionine/tyrosine aminotransferase
MQGTFTSFLVAGQCVPEKDTLLFIDPGFPVQKQQAVVLGYKYISFDVYNYRGDKLKDKLTEYLSKGNIACLIYSNPNNPAWFCLKEEELRIIGELATQYDTLVLEDLAYFAMDFRQDLSKPYTPPYQPSVGKYTDNYLLLISGSKAFSYAGQRIGVAAISNSLYHRSYPGLTQRYGSGTFGSVFIHRALYAISSGTSHSAQYALAAMFKAASDGSYNFLEEVKEYGRRSKKLKNSFQKYGFEIVYDNDLGEPIADGFYFTVRYPGMTGGELMKALIPFGISAISLTTTGSKQEGLRACTSFIKDHQYELLDERLKAFTYTRSNSRSACPPSC